jgi:hypothetical protein
MAKRFGVTTCRRPVARFRDFRSCTSSSSRARLRVFGGTAAVAFDLTCLSMRSLGDVDGTPAFEHSKSGSMYSVAGSFWRLRRILFGSPLRFLKFGAAMQVNEQSSRCPRFPKPQPPPSRARLRVLGGSAAVVSDLTVLARCDSLGTPMEHQPSSFRKAA